MKSKLLSVNPEMMIIHRDGFYFACQLSGSTELVRLGEPDIILLSYFYDSCRVEIVANQFFTGLVAKTRLTNIPLQQIYQRIEFFIQNKILIFSPSIQAEKIVPNKVLPTNDYSVVISNKNKLRLNANFALIGCAEGFQIWSAREQEFFVLASETLFLLISCSNGRQVKDISIKLAGVMDQTGLENNVGWLIQKGFLIQVESKELQDNLINSRKPITISNEVSNKVMSSKSWLDIDADGRIPVYFVPHMQNHYPLGLGLLFSAIEANEKNTLLEKYLLIPITYLSPEHFINGPYKKFGRGVWLFSNYMWSIETNMKISQAIKHHIPGNLTIHGGPSTPNYESKSREFFEQYKSVDICVHGEGEGAITEVLQCLYTTKSNHISYESTTLHQVSGITFRSYEKNGVVLRRTNSRPRLTKPDVIPSPYAEGYFDHYSDEPVEAAIIESNRGCPFGCTFCDWGSATNQKIRKFDLQRVKQEVEWIARKEIRVLWIADANFGLYDRDIELSKFIVEMKTKYHFPQEIVVNYTKNTTWRLAEIIKIFSQGEIISQGVISIQTTDVTTLEVINRKNIKTKKYDELSQIFNDLKLPLSTDLMLGLPGITVSAFKNDLQRYFDFDVSLKAYPTQLLPNSPMADPDYIEKYKIKTDENDFLISTYSYTEDDLSEMKRFYSLYTIADGYSLMRYVLRFLQWEYGIKAIDFLECIGEAVKNKTVLYPRIAFIVKYFEADKFMPGGWKIFYDEVAEIAKNDFNIERDSAFDVVLKVNELAMPDDSYEYPVSTLLAHDFEKYFLANNGVREKKQLKNLKDYPSVKLSFDDPDGMSYLNSQHIQYDTHQFFWEARSSIARAKSVSNIK